MDHEFISRVVQRVNRNVRTLDDHVSRSGGGAVDDLCDLAVTRTFTRALLDAGATRRELAAASGILQRTSDVMTFHRGRMCFDTASDRLLWSYASLYLRLLALAFSEAWDTHDDVPSPGELHGNVTARAHVALEVVAGDASRQAVERLMHALERSVVLAESLADAQSPHADESAALLARFDAW
ncbi:MAG: hypothetical protein DHS20C19_03390 [Acidimicrobiales bacterium]|nr:MAG: hypothetical protein DHS20C19_03390 [Acidimicrobiales bacterium]